MQLQCKPATAAHHADNGARHDVLHQGAIEGLAAQVLVVLLRHVFWRLKHLQADDFEPLSLKARDDVTHKAALYAIGFDHHVRALGVSTATALPGAAVPQARAVLRKCG